VKVFVVVIINVDVIVKLFYFSPLVEFVLLVGIWVVTLQ